MSIEEGERSEVLRNLNMNACPPVRSTCGVILHA